MVISVASSLRCVGIRLSYPIIYYPLKSTIYLRLAVKLGQLIGTVGIAVAVYALRSVRQFVGGRKRVCVLVLSENITAVVVFKGRGKVQLSVVLTNQTVQVVVGITNLKSAEFVL